MHSDAATARDAESALRKPAYRCTHLRSGSSCRGLSVIFLLTTGAAH
jgi:hypothetical protein